MSKREKKGSRGGVGGETTEKKIEIPPLRKKKSGRKGQGKRTKVGTAIVWYGKKKNGRTLLRKEKKRQPRIGKEDGKTPNICHLVP